MYGPHCVLETGPIAGCFAYAWIQAYHLPCGRQIGQVLEQEI